MLKEIDIKEERILQAKIQTEPNVIEEGLEVITPHLPTDTGPSDIICVDDSGRVGIIELKINEDDGMLLQAFRYFDYVNENLDAIKNMFPQAKIDTEATPRIILVAPSFSQTLIKAVKNISQPAIELYVYHYLEVGEGKTDMFCENIEVTAPKKPIKISNLDDHINYIREEDLRKLCIECIDKIKDIGFGIDVVPTQFYIGLQFRGRLISRFHTYRERFDIVYPKEKISGYWEDWDTLEIREKGDIKTEPFEKIKEGFIQMGGKLKEDTISSNEVKNQ